MADTIETEAKVIMDADASGLQSAFESLVNEISRTREELKEYKNDKEKSAELSQKLADQEKKLTQIIKANNYEIDASGVSYKQLNDVLKDLNKTYKTTADEASRLDLAPSINAINKELKGMDASIGNFQRNVGNYEGAIDNASKNLAQSFRQIGQSLPSLIEQPERFFMALAQSIPNLVEAYRNIEKAQKAAAVATEKQVELDEAEIANKTVLAKEQATLNTAKVTSAGASQSETKATTSLFTAEKEETKVTIESTAADKARIATARESIKVNNEETISVAELTEMEAIRINKTLSKRTQYNIELLKRRKLEKKSNDELTISTEAAAAAEEKEAVAATAAGAGATAMAEGEEVATVATKGLGAALSSFLLIAVVAATIIAVFGKDILKWAKNLKIFNNEASQAARLQKEWNKEMREGHQNAAKQLVDLQIYSRWATMVTKSDKERTIAAKEVLKTMGSAVTETNIAAVKNGEFAKSIDEVTKALVKQAQAEALTSKITEKYKDVIDAMDDLVDAQNGKLDAEAKNRLTFDMMDPTKTKQAMDLAVDGSIDRAQQKLNKVREGFEKWLEKFLNEFNPSELLFGKSGGSGSGSGDTWFSKWELYIKTYESQLEKLQGTYEEVDLSSIWKYSAEGLEYYTKMYDEYIEHYKGDEKQFKEAQANKAKYLNEFNEYHFKLQRQYVDSTKTEYQVDIDKLEEWYAAQKEIYKNAGEDTTALEAEYTKRKLDIEAKYVDKYKNASLHGMELELANLQDTMDKEIKEYQRKGIATTELEKHYAEERMKIISKYAKEETDNVIAQIKRQEDYRNRMNEVNLMNENQGGAMGGARERAYAAWGGTSITGKQRRQNEMNAANAELDIFKEAQNARIKAMEDALKDEKLFGEDRLQMEQDLADARVELELGTAERLAEIREKENENTREDVNETLDYISSSFQGLEQIFSDVYSAIENTIELKVKQGEISEEQAEKELEEYRGVQAAAAMMSTLASAVDSYRSLAGIPVVGPALGVAAAAAALAAGLTNVRLIMATTKSNLNATDAYANAMPSLSDYQPQYISNITGRDDTDFLRNSLDEKPLRAYVVEADISAAQEVANKREQETTW